LVLGRGEVEKGRQGRIRIEIEESKNVVE